MKPDLPPIQFTPFQVIPRPDAIELDPELGWRMWDRAVQQQEQACKDALKPNGSMRYCGAKP